MAIELLISGINADIYEYIDSRGSSPSRVFMEGLPEFEREKADALLRRFALLGAIRNEEQFIAEEKPIYAFKSFQVRLCCFFLPRATRKTLVITHGFKKKQGKMPRNELVRAKRIFNEIISEYKH